jgi:putative Holliday junction resolvase
MPRHLGIDYGTKRIGVAIGDTETRIATPLKTVRGRGDTANDASVVAELAAQEEAAAIVVGLPISMNETESAQTRLTRKFAADLARLSAKPVHLQDERLSSYAADEALQDAGINPRKRKHRGISDRLAAQRILQDYLDSLPKDH